MDKKNNTGNCNTGYRNSGDWNTGNGNTGNENTGNQNTGNENTGNQNTGYRNSGDWNTGNWNTGYCNTVSPTEILVFNKLCNVEIWNNCQKPSWMYFNLNLDIPAWVSFENMNIEDRKQYPDSEKLGGYLLGGIHKELSKEEKIKLFQEAAQKSWKKTTQKDRELTFKLPNFDANVFYEIFGIDVREPNTDIKLNDFTIEQLLKELSKRTSALEE